MLEQSPQCEAHSSTAFDRSRVVFVGSTAIIERVPCGHVQKIPYCASLEDIGRKHQGYARIANQPHFLAMVEYLPEHGIVSQSMPDGTLRDHLQSQGALISPSQRLLWAYEVSAALHILHATGVVYGNLKPENVLLDERLGVHLTDSSGSSVDEEQGSAWESVRLFMPRSIDSNPKMQAAIFALGWTIYENFTGTQPYGDLTDDIVEERFKIGEFPNTEDIYGHRDKVLLGKNSF